MIQSGQDAYEELKLLGFNLGEKCSRTTIAVSYNGVLVTRFDLEGKPSFANIYNSTGEVVTPKEFVDALRKTMTLPDLKTLESILITIAADEIVKAEMKVALEAGTLNFLQGMRIDS